jgi:hypothetical protein
MEAIVRETFAKAFGEVRGGLTTVRAIESNRYNFTLVLPKDHTRETMIRLMGEGIERHFGVARQVRSIEVDVITAPDGIRALDTREDDRMFGFGSIGVAHMAQRDSPQIPEGLMLIDIMNLHTVPPEKSSSGDEEMRAMKSRFRRAFGFGGRGVQITSMSDSLTMAQLCEVLEGGLDRPVIDETRLAGTYAINVHAEVTSTRQFLRVLCDKLGLVIAAGRRDVLMLVL